MALDREILLQLTPWVVVGLTVMWVAACGFGAWVVVTVAKIARG